MSQEIVNALDRLGATILLAAIIGKKGVTVDHLDESAFKKALKENIYFKDCEVNK